MVNVPHDQFVAETCLRLRFKYTAITQAFMHALLCNKLSQTAMSHATSVFSLLVDAVQLRAARIKKQLLNLMKLLYGEVATWLSRQVCFASQDCVEFVHRLLEGGTLEKWTRLRLSGTSKVVLVGAGQWQEARSADEVH